LNTLVLTFLAPNSLPYADGAVKNLLTHLNTLVMLIYQIKQFIDINYTTMLIWKLSLFHFCT